jgi:uncharacterized protein with PIN domain
MGMRFIADAMLGRLAKWLRLFGFDTLYIPDIEDAELLKVAKREGRVILTRDTRVTKRDIPGCLFVQSENVLEQVPQVIRDLGLDIPEESRCARCNGELVRVHDNEEIRDTVPEHVFHTYGLFHRCCRCDTIYWEGTQYRRFMKQMEQMRQEAARERK